MIADLLTKGLPPKVFHENTAHMGVVSLQDVSFSGSLYFRCFLDTFVMDIMDFKVIYLVKYSIFIHFDFVWFDLTKV